MSLYNSSQSFLLQSHLQTNKTFTRQKTGTSRLNDFSKVVKKVTKKGFFLGQAWISALPIHFLMLQMHPFLLDIWLQKPLVMSLVRLKISSWKIVE